MKAERDCFDPAARSMPLSTSLESVMDVFSFILLLYYHAEYRKSGVLHGLRRGLQSIAAFAAGNWKMVQFALATALL